MCCVCQIIAHLISDGCVFKVAPTTSWNQQMVWKLLKDTDNNLIYDLWELQEILWYIGRDDFVFL